MVRSGHPAVEVVAGPSGGEGEVGRVEEVRPHLEGLDAQPPAGERPGQGEGERRLPRAAVRSGDDECRAVRHQNSTPFWAFRPLSNPCLTRADLGDRVGGGDQPLRGAPSGQDDGAPGAASAEEAQDGLLGEQVPGDGVADLVEDRPGRSAPSRPPPRRSGAPPPPPGGGPRSADRSRAGRNRGPSRRSRRRPVSFSAANSPVSMSDLTNWIDRDRDAVAVRPEGHPQGGRRLSLSVAGEDQDPVLLHSSDVPPSFPTNAYRLSLSLPRFPGCAAIPQRAARKNAAAIPVAANIMRFAARMWPRTSGTTGSPSSAGSRAAPAAPSRPRDGSPAPRQTPPPRSPRSGSCASARRAGRSARRPTPCSPRRAAAAVDDRRREPRGDVVRPVVDLRGGPAEIDVAFVPVADHRIERIDRLVGHRRRPARRAPRRRAAR